MVDNDRIKLYAQTLMGACPAGSQVILFGSQARGDAHIKSDVDFLVIEPQVRGRVTEAARLARVLRPLRAPVDIVVVAAHDYNTWKDTPALFTIMPTAKGDPWRDNAATIACASDKGG